MATPVFYSFHFDNDVFRVQQIRNIGVIEDNKPVSANDWEEVKRKGDSSIEKWIDDNMKYRRCIIVLIGEKTADRRWVKYEIKKAWSDRKGLLGIYIHNLKDPKTGQCSKGPNPFEQFTFNDGTKMSRYVTCYDPNSQDAYNDIKRNLESWVQHAIDQRQK